MGNIRDIIDGNFF